MTPAAAVASSDAAAGGHCEAAGIGPDRLADWIRSCVKRSDAGSSRVAAFQPRPRRPQLWRQGVTTETVARDWTVERLSARFGDQIVEAALLSSRLCVADEAICLPLRRLVDLIAGDPPTALAYLRQWNAVDWPPGLLHAAESLCRPFGVARITSLNLWIGASGVYTPAHRDDDDNFIVALQGRKRFLIYPPIRGRDGKTDARRDRNGLVFVLHPGDVFFLPAGWMHHVLAWDLSVALNMWIEHDARSTKPDLRHG